MPIDLSTDKARRQYHRTVLQIMAKLERTIERQLKPLINRQYMDAATLITQGVKDVDHVVNLQTTRLRKILRAHYRRVAMTAGRNSIQFFEQQKGMNESFWNDVNTYIALNTGRKITQMQNTTKKMLGIVIQTGVNAGQTNREIATRLRNTGKVDSKFRAIRIARTETLGIYNSATDASVRDTGLKFIRVWSTTKDLRTRRRKKKSIYDHWVVDGQKRKQNEPFDVSNEPLRYPGDPNGSAGNVISCRCVLLYERDRSNEMQPKPIPGARPVSSLPVIPKPVDESLVTIENKIRNDAIESAVVIGQDGKTILTKTGDKTSVEFTAKEVSLFENAILTHNHPSGLSFSNNDLRMAHNAKLKEIRAVTKDKLYKANINKNVDIEAVLDEFNDSGLYSVTMDKNYDKFMPLADAGKITEKEAWKSIKIETTHDTMKRAAKKFPQWIKYEQSSF